MRLPLAVLVAFMLWHAGPAFAQPATNSPPEALDESPGDTERDAAAAAVEPAPTVELAPANAPDTEQSASAPEPAALDTVTVADRRLLELLLALTDPESSAQRAQAARALGNSGDARAAGSLRYLLTRDELQVRIAAVEALATFRGDRVEAALAGVLAQHRFAGSLRQAAARALGAQGTESAAERLWHARGEEGSTVGTVVRAELQTHHAAFYREKLAHQPHVSDRSGRVPMVIGMAVHGGYFMTTLAQLASGEPGALSAIGGAAIGGITPYLLTLDGDFPAADGAWIVSTTTVGLGLGLLGGVALDAEAQDIRALGVGGQVLGLGAGLFTRSHVGLTANQIGYIDLAGVIGIGAAGGGTLLDPTISDASRAGWLELGLVAGITYGVVAASALDIDGNDAGAIGSFMGAGAWAGVWMPSLVLGPDAEGRERVAGLLLGASTGFVGGTLLTEALDITPTETVAPIVGALLGSGAGGGAALLLHDGLSEPTQVGMLLGGGAGGALLGALAAIDAPPARAGDKVMTVGALGFGLWQGVGFALAAGGDGPQVSGAGLLVTSGLGTASLIATRYFDPRPVEVGVSLAGAVWGGWLAGWTAYVLSQSDASIDEDDVLLTALLGSDVGLLLGALAVSPVLDVPEARLGWINVAGVLGLGLGTSIGAVTGESIAAGNVIGTAAGLLAGTLITATIDFDSRSATRGAIDTRSTEGFSLHDLKPSFSFVASEPGRMTPVMLLTGRM